VHIRVPAGETNSFIGGTDGSNPLSSGGESVSLPELLSSVENLGFPRSSASCLITAQHPADQFGVVLVTYEMQFARDVVEFMGRTAE
jgi:hypothetical protein